MKEKLLNIFYKVFGIFFLTCKEAVAEMNSDHHGHKHSVTGVRLKIHLVFCDVCRFYYSASIALGNAVKNLAKKSESEINLDELNNELMTKFVPVKSEKNKK